jgi:esterase
MLPLFYHHSTTKKTHSPNPPILILHGLLGSSRNWRSIAPHLADTCPVWALDMRNHGQSPHHKEHDYESMVYDVLYFIKKHAIPAPIILGHSMGGKVAMRLACHYPNLIKGLIIVDIAPKSYQEVHYDKEFKAMATMPLNTLHSRQEAAHYMRQFIDDEDHIQFLLTNLKRQNDGFEWQINLPTLTTALTHLANNSLEPDAHYHGPTLFIRGKKSYFIEDEDLKKIQHFFPQSQIITLDNSGHNPHRDEPEAFCKTVIDFIHTIAH